MGEGDAEWGQRGVAVVRLAEGADPEAADQLQAHCRASLAACATSAVSRLRFAS